MQLPSSVTDRQELTKKIEAAVNLKIEQKTIAEDITAIAADAKEKYAISKRSFNKLVNTRLLQIRDQEKYQEEKDICDVVFEINESLFGA